MTVAALKLGFTPQEFTKYVATLGPFEWEPIGVTLHNTFNPDLKMVDGYLSSKKWNEAQLIDNWWQNYIKLKWYGGPHCFVFRDKIYVAMPLTMHGTHSPSFNKNYFGIEVIGNYDVETLPDSIEANTIHAAACLLNCIGVKASNKTVVFHGEDPRTTHKHCPGKNFGPKEKWVAAIRNEQLKK